MITVILDNEAVDALRNPHHPHHKDAMKVFEANRPSRRSNTARRTLVPTAVRVEAAWDRTAADAATINQLRIEDVPLDKQWANLAARILAEHHVSVADAHMGAAIRLQPDTDDVVVVTSDPGDMNTVAGARAIRIVSL